MAELLTKGGISRFFSFGFKSNKMHNVDSILQILDIKHHNKKVILTLSDSNYFYDNFILNDNHKNLNKFELIYVNQLTTYRVKNEIEKKTFSIKLNQEYKIASVMNEKIGHPTFYNEGNFIVNNDNNNKEREEEKNNISNSNIDPPIIDASNIKQEENTIMNNFNNNERIQQDEHQVSTFYFFEDRKKSKSLKKKLDEDLNLENLNLNSQKNSDKKDIKNKENLVNQEVLNEEPNKIISSNYAALIVRHENIIYNDDNTNNNIIRIPNSNPNPILKIKKPISQSVSNNSIPHQVLPHASNQVDKPRTVPKLIHNTICRPISFLSELESNYTIKIRVIDIQITSYNNIFYTVIDDEDSLSQLFLNTRHMMNYSHRIKINRIYLFSNGRVDDNKGLKKTFENEIIKYQITIDDSTKVIEVPEDNSIKSNIFDSIVKFDKIRESFINEKYYINILGYILHVRDTNKDDFYPKYVILTDTHPLELKILLTKKNIDNFDLEHKLKINEVVLMTRMLINFNNGYYLTASESSVFENFSLFLNNKAVEELIDFNKYFKLNNVNGNARLNHNEKFSNHIGLKYDHIKEVVQIINMSYAYSSKSDNIYNNPNPLDLKRNSSSRMIKATIVGFVHDISNMYFGCPMCRKGNINISTSGVIYNCERESCLLTVKSKVFYKIRIYTRDVSGELALTLFDNTGADFFGISASHYEKVFQNNNNIELDKIKEKIEFKQFYFLVRINYKNDMKYNSCTVESFESDWNIVNEIKNSRTRLNKWKIFKDILFFYI